jgi:Ca-activated chloride channel family protein
MSFAAPLFLLGLLLVPVAAWAYAAHVRRRRTAASAFANPDLLPAVAPMRPAGGATRRSRCTPWRPPALLVALARPQTTVAVPVEQATVMLVTDVSGSMLSRDVRPDRLTAARSAADSMIERLPEKVRAGLVAFNQRAQIVQSPTIDHAVVRQRILGLRSSGGTATGDGITAGWRRSARPPRPAASARPRRSSCSPTARRRAGATSATPPARRRG